jgi:predicted transcriptional regulator
VGRRRTEEAERRPAGALRGERQGEVIAFESVELLWRVLTAKRWELSKVMTGAGPMSIREAARRVGRDAKPVHGEVHALLDAGLLERTEAGRGVVPYDEVRVDFTLTKAA